MWAICGPRSALDHPVSHWSLVPRQSLSAIERRELGKLTHCQALLPLLPESMKEQSLSPGRNQIRSHCTKLHPPHRLRKPRRNTQAHDAATHLICRRRRVEFCAYSQQPDCDSWIALGPWLSVLLSLQCLLWKDEPKWSVLKASTPCLFWRCNANMMTLPLLKMFHFYQCWRK